MVLVLPCFMENYKFFKSSLIEKERWRETEMPSSFYFSFFVVSSLCFQLTFPPLKWKEENFINRHSRSLEIL